MGKLKYKIKKLTQYSASIFIGVVSVFIGKLSGFNTSEIALAIFSGFSALYYIFERLTNRIKSDKINSELELVLLKNRIIYIDDSVFKEKANDCFKKIFYLYEQDKEKEIKLFINSPGGDYESLALIINTIQSVGISFVGYVIGRADSAAAILLQFCVKRYAAPYSTIFFHEGRFSTEISIKHAHFSELKEIVCDLSRTVEKIKKIEIDTTEFICKRTGLSSEYLQEIYDKDLSAKEAKELNLIDGIISEDEILKF